MIQPRLRRRPYLTAVAVEFCLLVWLSMTGGAVAQVPPARARAPAAPQAAPDPAGQPPPDPLYNLLLQQPSIDTESPASVRAEFDPPVARAGGYVVYRIEVNALNESVKLPEKLPLPAGLSLEEPTRGHVLMPQVDKLAPATTLIFRVHTASNGVFVIPSFEIEVYGKRARVPPATVNMVAANAPSGGEALHLALEAVGSNTYAGQAIPVRVVLADPPDGSVVGLLQVQVEGDSLLTDNLQSRQRREAVWREGKQVPALISEQNVFALKGGKLVLHATAHALLNRAVPNAPGRTQPQRLMVESLPLELNIEDVPKEGRLPGYTGLIGVFQLEPTKINTNEVRAGEPITLTVILKGEGNYNHLIPPKPERARGWQIFPPSLDAGPVYYSATVARRIFVYALIPLSAKITQTPAIPFCYFDPSNRAYVDLTIPSLPLKVLPAPAGELAPPPDAAAAGAVAEGEESSPQPKEPAMTGLADTLGTAVSSLQPLQQRAWFLCLQLIPALILAGVWGWGKRRTYRESHPEVLLRRKARRALRGRLLEIRGALAAQDATAFVVAAADAFREAAAPGLDAAPEALVGEDILEELPSSDPRGRSAGLVRDLFAAADAWQFRQRRPAPELLQAHAEIEALLEVMRRRL